MRCDKCGKRFYDNWVPADNWPKYDIIQRCGAVSHTSKINLCVECSRKFKEWLEKESEQNKESTSQVD